MFSKVKAHFPMNKNLPENIKGGNGEYPIITNDDVEPLQIVGKYVHHRFWNELRKIYEKDPRGFYNQEELDPIVKLDDIKYSLKYDECFHEDTYFNMQVRKSYHIGQRKLFLSEMQFLTNYLDSAEEEAVVIYAGAAPSVKMWVLMQLFKNVKFILIDPNEFFIYWGQYDKPHYTAAETGEVLYLSYSNSDMYNSYRTEWNRKHIKYYNPTSDTVEDIMDKEYGTTNTQGKYSQLVKSGKYNKKRLIDTSKIFEVLSPFVSQKSFEFALKDKKSRIICCEEYMTADVANKINSAFKNVYGDKGPKLLFMSDIRTNTGSDESPDDLDIIWNNALTYPWLRIIQPDYTMLKFRIPYYNEGNDVNYNIYQQYFDLATDHGFDYIQDTIEKKGMSMFEGEIFLQAWQNKFSTEMRLIIKKETIINNQMKFWNVRDLEDNVFAYNTLMRTNLFFKNNNANESLGYDHCNDCALENLIWKTYKNKFNKKEFNIIKWVEFMNSILHINLINRFGYIGHGYLFKNFKVNENLITKHKMIVLQ